MKNRRVGIRVPDHESFTDDSFPYLQRKRSEGFSVDEKCTEVVKGTPFPLS